MAAGVRAGGQVFGARVVSARIRAAAGDTGVGCDSGACRYQSQGWQVAP